LANHKFEELAEAYVTGIKQFIKGGA